VAEKKEFDGASQQLKIYTGKNNNLKKGDHVQWIDETGAKHYSEVIAASGNSFSVTADKEPAKVFVYGREISDFRMVDYDALSMLNLSATQELAKRLEALEQENAALKNENETLKTMVGGKADLSGMNKLKAQVDELKALMEKNGIRSEK
jgi:hypothetical protein